MNSVLNYGEAKNILLRNYSNNVMLKRCLKGTTIIKQLLDTDLQVTKLLILSANESLCMTLVSFSRTEAATNLRYPA